MTGGCLCGAVRYEVRGPLRQVVNCHCEECRRWTGHYLAATAVPRDALLIEDESRLRWHDSPTSPHRARRGFCSACGSSLFWEPRDDDRIAIAAGSLDRPTGLRTVTDIWTASASDR